MIYNNNTLSNILYYFEYSNKKCILFESHFHMKRNQFLIRNYSIIIVSLTLGDVLISANMMVYHLDSPLTSFLLSLQYLVIISQIFCYNVLLSPYGIVHPYFLL